MSKRVRPGDEHDPPSTLDTPNTASAPDAQLLRQLGWPDDQTAQTPPADAAEFLRMARVGALANSALVIHDMDLSGVDLTNVDLTGVDLSGCILVGADLRGANLSCVTLAKANLRGANLQGAFLAAANFSQATLDGAYLRAVTADGALFVGASFVDAVLSEGRFDRATFEYATLVRTAMNDSQLMRCNLCHVTGKEVNLAGSDLSWAVFEQGSFRRIDVVGATLDRHALVSQARCVRGVRSGVYQETWAALIAEAFETVVREIADAWADTTQALQVSMAAWLHAWQLAKLTFVERHACVISPNRQWGALPEGDASAILWCPYGRHVAAIYLGVDALSPPGEHITRYRWDVIVPYAGAADGLSAAYQHAAAQPWLARVEIAQWGDTITPGMVSRTKLMLREAARHIVNSTQNHQALPILVNQIVAPDAYFP